MRNRLFATFALALAASPAISHVDKDECLGHHWFDKAYSHEMHLQLIVIGTFFALYALSRFVVKARRTA